MKEIDIQDGINASHIQAALDCLKAVECDGFNRFRLDDLEYGLELILSHLEEKMGLVDVVKPDP